MNLREEIIRNIMETPLTDDEIVFLFEDIMEDRNKAKELWGLLKKIPKRQAFRFWEVCYREDDLKRWVEFLRNESLKEASIWRDDIIKEFYEKLERWWDDDDPTRWANQRFKGKFGDLRGSLTHLVEAEEIVDELQPTPDELRRWRRFVLRKALGYLLRGER